MLSRLCPPAKLFRLNRPGSPPTGSSSRQSRPSAEQDTEKQRGNRIDHLNDIADRARSCGSLLRTPGRYSFDYGSPRCDLEVLCDDHPRDTRAAERSQLPVLPGRAFRLRLCPSLPAT